MRRPLLVAAIAILASASAAGCADARSARGGDGASATTNPRGSVVWGPDATGAGAGSTEPTGAEVSGETAPADGSLPSPTVGHVDVELPAIADDPPLTCPPTTVRVTTADGLVAALAGAAPGDVIEIAPGTYDGTFVAAVAGTVDRPIWLCGGRDAVLDAGGVRSGYGLHLDGANHWRVVGFTIHDAQKGVVADGVTDTVIQGLRVEDIGDEAIHLRAASTANVVQDNEIRHTGQRRDTFGEGVYVGTAQSNWCTISDCRPDPSDGNVVQRNDIADTTAESVDIKEGTTGGVVRHNEFDGSSLSGADSWVDVKGNDWLIQDNTGAHTSMDGFQLHEIVKGWGTGNEFAANTADVDGPGYGFATTNTSGNVVRCDNQVTRANRGVADIDCTP